MQPADDPDGAAREEPGGRAIEGHSPRDLFLAGGAGAGEGAGAAGGAGDAVGGAKSPTASDRAPSSSGPGLWEPPLAEVVDALIPGLGVSALIGRGGMGAVYRGTQTSLDRPVAIKLLPPELAADPEFEARFRREARSMAKLNHPHIVQIYDFGQTHQGHFYIVMEYVDGTDLHHLIRTGHLDCTGALNAVCQICDALTYAHENGFVHRDIKPANIFITSIGILKVGDFGLAKMVDPDAATAGTDRFGLTQTGFAMGTPHYVAPEQMGAGEVDARADIYSLGVMFYEMLTGGVPRGNFKVPSQKVAGLDPRLDAIVARAMEEDPADRYQSTGELRADSTSVLTTPPPVRGEPVAEEEVVEALPPPGRAIPRAQPVAAKPASRNRGPAVIVATIGLTLVALVAGAILILSQREGAKDVAGHGEGPPPPIGVADPVDPAEPADPGADPPDVPADPPGPAEDVPEPPDPPLEPAEGPDDPVVAGVDEPASGPGDDPGSEITPPGPPHENGDSEPESDPGPRDRGQDPDTSPENPEDPQVPPMPDVPEPPAEDPVGFRLAEIDEKYREMFEAPYETALATLNGQFADALGREEAAATKAGDLKTVTAFQNESHRIKNGDDAGPPADPDAPPKLKQLRKTWHAQAAQLRENRAAAKADADTALGKALLAYQQELVVAKDLEGARRVNSIREDAAAAQQIAAAGGPEDGGKTPQNPGGAGAPEIPLWLRKAKEAGGEIRIWGMIDGEPIDEKDFAREFRGSDYVKVAIDGDNTHTCGVLGVRRRGNGIAVTRFTEANVHNPGKHGYIGTREHRDIGLISRMNADFVSGGEIWGTLGGSFVIEDEPVYLSGKSNPYGLYLDEDGKVHFWGLVTAGIDPDKKTFLGEVEERINRSAPRLAEVVNQRIYWQGTDLKVHAVNFDRNGHTMTDEAIPDQPGEKLATILPADPRTVGYWIALAEGGNVYAERRGGFAEPVEEWSPAIGLRTGRRGGGRETGIVIARPDGTWLPVGVLDPELSAQIQGIERAIDLDAWLIHDQKGETVSRVVVWIEP